MSVPKLRFKEFDGYWNKNTIGNFVLNYKGGASLTPADFVDYSECEVIPKKAISSGGALQLDKDVPTFCTPEFFNLNQNYVVDSEYLITTLRDLVPSGPSIGYIVKYEGDKQYILAQGVYGFRIKNDLCRDFLIQFSNTSKFRLHMQSIMVGSTQVHIRNHDYFSTELYTPSLLEQTQIASFLSTVDEKINQLTQKHQLLTQYKQGMMQKLFSQQIRFKADDGSEFREWKIGKLGDITSIQGGFAFKSTNFGKGMTKVIRIGDIEKNINLDSFTGIYSNEIPDTRYLISENAIVMALSGATFGKLGKVNQGYAYINQRVATFKVFEDSLNEFVYQIMLSQEFTTYIQSIPSASAQPNISNQDVINFEMMIPCLEEQTKIANFLSAIDQKIEVTEQQIEQAKQWKKGLLQQMFV